MHFSSVWLLSFAVAMLQASEHSGTKITVQFGSPANATHHTVYRQEDRQRSEYRNSFGRRQGADPIYGPRLARIVRCDLGQAFELNLDTSEYTSAPYPPKALTEEEIKARGLGTPSMRQAENPTIRVEVKTTDTGERKEIFGHIARHVITTRTQTPLQGSHTEPQESVTDGWYIDFDQQLSCDPKWPQGRQGYTFGYLSAGNGKQPMEKPEFVRIGEPETGFALSSRTTFKSPSPPPDGAISNSEMRVTQFEEGPLDPALFEIPAGFKQVDQIERNPPSSALAGKP
jgi:hypothetical protein